MIALVVIILFVLLFPNYTTSPNSKLSAVCSSDIYTVLEKNKL